MTKRRKPRDYQIAAVESIFDYFEKKTGNPVVALPTGTGKSVVIAALLEAIFWQYGTQKVLVITHVKELIQQNYEKLLDQWPSAPAGINSAGLGRRDVHQSIIFCGIGSVAKQWALFGKVDLVVIDEAHLVSPTDTTMYQKFLAGLKSVNSKVKVIGFTATPWRLGHGRITENDHIFTDLCFDMTSIEAFNWLIAQGYLAPLVPKRTKYMLSTDGIHIRGGEFISSEVQLAHDKKEITEAAIRETLEVAGDRNHWLVFCAGVQHAIHTAEVLNYFGISAIAIHSEMTDKERDQALRDWKSGKYRAATNNNVLTTGVDFPGIDLIIMLRVTMSVVLWVQMLGRGTRPCDGKIDCMVLDFARNTKRLGEINNPRVPGKKGDVGGDAPVRCCDVCETYQHASRLICINEACKAVFPPPPTQLKGSSGDEPLIKGDMPIVEVFKVDHITYGQHDKVGSPPSVRVTYYCGVKHFSEWVAFEHDNQFAQRKAKQWWREHSDWSFPTSTKEALACCAEAVRPSTHLRMWINQRYPTILAHCYDGTAFGTEEASQDVPQVQVYEKPEPKPAQPRKEGSEERWAPKSNTGFDDLDDDIPF